jgi:hypothetical protein
MKADEFDERFDRGEDITSELDLAAARRPGAEPRRVNVDLLVGADRARTTRPSQALCRYMFVRQLRGQI